MAKGTLARDIKGGSGCRSFAISHPGDEARGLHPCWARALPLAAPHLKILYFYILRQELITLPRWASESLWTLHRPWTFDPPVSAAGIPGLRHCRESTQVMQAIATDVEHWLWMWTLRKHVQKEHPHRTLDKMYYFLFYIFCVLTLTRKIMFQWKYTCITTLNISFLKIPFFWTYWHRNLYFWDS